MKGHTGMVDLDAALFELAEAALRNAHAPYSGFHVGAALYSLSGALHSGCNVESAAYPLTSCAERAAITAAVRAEGPQLQIVRMVVLARGRDGQLLPATPCGGCRQLLSEFGSGLELVFNDPQGQLRRITVSELLPLAFGLPAQARGHS